MSWRGKLAPSNRWLNHEPNTSSCRVGGQLTQSMLWLKCFRNTTRFKAHGHTTESKFWLKEWPKIRCSRSPPSTCVISRTSEQMIRQGWRIGHPEYACVEGKSLFQISENHCDSSNPSLTCTSFLTSSYQCFVPGSTIRATCPTYTMKHTSDHPSVEFLVRLIQHRPPFIHHLQRRVGFPDGRPSAAPPEREGGATAPLQTARRG